MYGVQSSWKIEIKRSVAHHFCKMWQKRDKSQRFYWVFLSSHSYQGTVPHFYLANTNKVWIGALSLLECWAQPFAADSVNVCLPSRRLLEQLNRGRQNKSRGSKVLIFHVIYLCLCQKRDDFPHLASFMFLLFLYPLYSVWDVASGGERWGTRSTFVWHLIKTRFYVLFCFLSFSCFGVKGTLDMNELLWKNILNTTVYELGIVEQPRDAARGCGQGVGTVCGSFPAPLSLILNVNQRDWQTLSPPGRLVLAVSTPERDLFTYMLVLPSHSTL